MNYNFSVFVDKPQRVDIYMSALFEDFSRSYIQKMIDRGQLRVNNKTLNKNLKIKNKDEILLEIKTQSLDILPEKMDLDIVYEDSEIIIINKNAGINVHPVPWEGWKSGTLVNAVLYHCKENLPTIWWVERPWIVHRLDKDTSGVIMVAKTDKMMNYLSKIIKERNIEKYYIAIVFWKVKFNDIKIESYIWRDKNDRKKMTTKDPVNPKLAITHLKIIDYIDNRFTILRVKLETGRTHQIRVHLASIWYPIIWDKVYWNPKINKEMKTVYWLRRQALHAKELKLKLYGKDVEFIWELKDDMVKIINKK